MSAVSIDIGTSVLKKNTVGAIGTYHNMQITAYYNDFTTYLRQILYSLCIFLQQHIIATGQLSEIEFMVNDDGDSSIRF